MQKTDRTAKACRCPERDKMGEFACENPAQCWEPCGQLGKSDEHAVCVSLSAVTGPYASLRQGAQMTEVGKAAKKMGRERTAVLKKLEPVPPRATPKRSSEIKPAKPFGFSYEFSFVRGWRRYYQWFKTEKARNQALLNFTRKHAQSDWVRDIRQEEKNHSTQRET